MVFIVCFKKNIFCFCYIECKFIGVKSKGSSLRSLSRVLLMAVMGRNSRPEVFLGKGVLEICSKFTGEYPCRSVITIKLQSNFIEITLRHGCSPENLLFIFRTPYPKNISGGLLLQIKFSFNDLSGQCENIR